MSEHYYNTNDLNGEDLKKANTKGLSQEKQVLLSFKKNPKQTASDVWKSLETDSPLTSIRRAMSNLCDDLEILKEMKKGIYGSPEHYYRIKNNN